MIRCAVGLPNVGEFGDPRVLRDLAVLAEESGWDGVYVWDHVLFHEPDWPVANPTVAAAAIAAATGRIRIMLACVLARRRVQVVARETVAWTSCRTAASRWWPRSAPSIWSFPASVSRPTCGPGARR
jgi:hypothetical protein